MADRLPAPAPGVRRRDPGRPRHGVRGDGRQHRRRVLINVVQVWTPPASTTRHPRRDEERRRADRDDRGLDDPAAGHLRPAGEGRLSVDWWAIISNTSAGRHRHDGGDYALAAMGLNMHFGYTGLLNFGQVGFMAVGAYGVGVTDRHATTCRCGSGILVGPGCRRRAGPAARPADAAAAGRLPGDRHDRRRPRSSGWWCGRPATERLLGGSNGLHGLRRRVPDTWNFISDPSTAYGVRCSAASTSVPRRQPLVMLVGWSLVAICRRHRCGCWCRSPGAGSAVDPRGRGRRPGARQERLRYKMQA